MQLSKNFTLAEFTRSSDHPEIDNTPTDDHINAAILLFEHCIQPVRDHFGPTKINSGYRSPALNQVVRGVATSQHCFGEACDIEVPGVANATLAEWIRDNIDFDQLILEFYTPGIPDSGWVHVSYKAHGGNRHQIFTAMKENGKTVYKEGIIA
jgi:zinc D-Ala-D-Ala carboxypeptidase